VHAYQCQCHGYVVLPDRWTALGGSRNEDLWGAIGGLHQTSDGYVRIHDSFPNHRDGSLALLGLGEEATREDVAARFADWISLGLERDALQNKLVVAALRSYKQ